MWELNINSASIRSGVEACFKSLINKKLIENEGSEEWFHIMADASYLAAQIKKNRGCAVIRTKKQAEMVGEILENLGGHICEWKEEENRTFKTLVHLFSHEYEMKIKQLA